MEDRIAKYFRVFQDIVAGIRRGQFAAGAPVPSENDLIKLYGISNTTARRVLRELEQAGWVNRVRGRGTFVRDNRVDRGVTRILGFTKNMMEAGRVPSTKLLDVKVRRLGRRLGINGRHCVLRGPVCVVERLRLADGVPVMRETRYVSEELCPGIHKKNLQGSLYDIYECEYGLQLVRIDQSLSAIVTDGRKAGFTGVKGPIPAFLVEGVTFCGKELVLEMEESLYRGDMYRFTVQATR